MKVPMTVSAEVCENCQRVTEIIITDGNLHIMESRKRFVGTACSLHRKLKVARAYSNMPMTFSKKVQGNVHYGPCLKFCFKVNSLNIVTDAHLSTTHKVRELF